MSDIDFEKVGKKIKELRNEKGLKIQELADILKVDKAAVSQWENGKNIGVENLYKLSKLFNTSINYIIDENDNIDFEKYKKKFDLNQYDNIYGNSNLAIEYLNKVKVIKDDFFELLINKYEDKSYDKQKFNFLKDYFKPDYHYLFERYGDYIHSEEMLIKEIYNMDKDNKRFELEKVYIFKRNSINTSYIMFGECKQELYETYLSTLNKPAKDNMLAYELKLLSDKEVEENKKIKILLNNGASFMKRYEALSKTISEEDLEFIEGNKKEAEELNRFFDHDNAYEIANSKNGIFPNSLVNWKNYTLEKYLSFVDNKRTEYYKSLVNYKDKEPLRYYESLKEYYEN